MFNTAHNSTPSIKHADDLDEQLEEGNADLHSDPEEYAANAFAGFLLMPKIGVRQAFNARDWSIADPQPEQIRGRLPFWRRPNACRHLEYGLRRDSFGHSRTSAKSPTPHHSSAAAK